MRYKKIVTSLFQDKSFIRDYQVEVQGHTTATDWNGKENIEEYLKKREYEIETNIYLNEGKTDEEYAEEISYNKFSKIYIYTLKAVSLGIDCFFKKTPLRRNDVFWVLFYSHIKAHLIVVNSW